MARRRRRGLSEEERALWARVTAAATPLRPDPQVPSVGAELGEPLPPAPVVRPAPAPVSLPARLPGRAGGGPMVQVFPALGPAGIPRTPRMDRGRFERLRRGRLEPDARLDLHGLTAERAHGALIGFVLAAHARGDRLVLVITGKGREGDSLALAPHRRGILRHSVPHWLSAPPLVMAILDVLPAHTRHGGAGALYVYLRRRREG